MADCRAAFLVPMFGERATRTRLEEAVVIHQPAFLVAEDLTTAMEETPYSVAQEGLA